MQKFFIKFHLPTILVTQVVVLLADCMFFTLKAYTEVNTIGLTQTTAIFASLKAITVLLGFGMISAFSLNAVSPYRLGFEASRTSQASWITYCVQYSLLTSFVTSIVHVSCVQVLQAVVAHYPVTANLWIAYYWMFQTFTIAQLFGLLLMTFVKSSWAWNAVAVYAVLVMCSRMDNLNISNLIELFTGFGLALKPNYLSLFGYGAIIGVGVMILLVQLNYWLFSKKETYASI